jgi:hypothetical protein
MTTIAVIDGMGGGIGVQIVTQLRQELPLDVEILAVGANAVAIDRMTPEARPRPVAGPAAKTRFVSQSTWPTLSSRPSAR